MQRIHLSLYLFVLILFHNNVFAHSSNESCQNNAVFNIGTGIYDITGPAAEQGMMGYGMITQQTAGILQRLWARAFVIESSCNNKRVVFVNADLGQIFQAVKQQVIAQLQKKYGDRYTNDNVLLTATHTHSGPGGYSTDTFYNITTLGFSKENFSVIVNGIVAAIELAEKNKTAGEIKFIQGELSGITNNRSPEAYLLNPPAERARYQKNTDVEMNLIRFNRQDGFPLGMINWFAIHGVSMNNKNHLINGDNKGYAEYLFEKEFNQDRTASQFVGAFAQANAGDVTPNEYGQEGGTGTLGIMAVEKAGEAQYLKAKELFTQAKTTITGGVDYRHIFVAMNDVEIQPTFTHGTTQHTCTAAIGVSMLAGTQDGEGFGAQGITCEEASQALPNFVCKNMTTSCQGVKPIAIETGAYSPPWTPAILPLQMIQIGNLFIAAVPTEITTMTGRRIIETIKQQLPDPEHYHVVLSSLANAYAGYVATTEEYALQRYEAASTHFGPWTSAALQQEFAQLTQSLIQGTSLPPGPTPLDLLPSQTNEQPNVLFDDVPLGKKFGALYQDVNPRYHPGDLVQAIFWGAHPKNNYRIQNTFLEVQHLENGKWHTIRTDNDWDTEYHWQRNSVAYSLITIVWRTPKNLPAGRYRLIHQGDWKSIAGIIRPYSGFSALFDIK